MEAAGEEPPKENTANSSPSSDVNTPESSPAPQPPDHKKEERLSNKQRREERLKVDKNVEQFMKSLNPIPTLEEKFSLVCKKFAQTSDENRKLHFYIKQTEKKFVLLEKEKDHLQLEYNKVVLVKAKLENLCRELQKQNKAVKEESLLKIREEEERRKETQAKFQNTLAEITTLLQQNNEKNAKLRDDNISMTEKFKSVVQQYQLREQQVDKMAKQMTLESELSDTKLQKANLEHQAEKERMIAEMEQLQVTLAHYRAKILELQATETALKEQLTVYTDKYEEFQSALVKSNQMFISFKDQMEKMAKQIHKLEKESLTWKQKWEGSQKALLDMCGERQASEERCSASARQLHHMQSLCRTLQAERTQLLNTLKEHNIERPPLPVMPPTPSQVQLASDAKVDAVAANCAQLRQSLAHIQSQLTTLSKDKEEAAKSEKPKKSKSKKNKAEKQAQKLAAEKIESKEPEINDTVVQPKPEEQPKPEGPTVPEVKVEGEGSESPKDKIDSKTMESLIHAINMANINLCDLEVVNDEENDDNISKDAIIEEVTDDDIAKLNDISPLDTVSNKPEEILAEIVKESVSQSISSQDVADFKDNSPLDTVSNKPEEILAETVKESVSQSISSQDIADLKDNTSMEPVTSSDKSSAEADVQEIGSETKLVDNINSNQTPQLNGDKTEKIEDDDKLITDLNEKIAAEVMHIAEAQISSPKKDKDIKEVVSQDITKTETQVSESAVENA